MKPVVRLEEHKALFRDEAAMLEFVKILQDVTMAYSMVTITHEGRPVCVLIPLEGEGRP